MDVGRGCREGYKRTIRRTRKQVKRSCFNGTAPCRRQSARTDLKRSELQVTAEGAVSFQGFSGDHEWFIFELLGTSR